MVEILELQGYFPSWSALSFSIVGVVSVLFGIAVVVFLIIEECEDFGWSVFGGFLGAVGLATIGSVIMFAVFFFVDLFSEDTDPMAAFDEQYPGINVLYQDDDQVHDIFDYIGVMHSESNFAAHEVSVFFEDGTKHEDVYAVFERSGRENISHTFSFAEREDKDDDTIIHSKSQLVEVRTGENLEEMTKNGAAPAFGFDDKNDLVEYGGDTDNSADTVEPSSPENATAQADESTWKSSLAVVLKWTGGILGALVVFVLLAALSAKIFFARADKVRTKLKGKN